MKRQIKSYSILAIRSKSGRYGLIICLLSLIAGNFCSAQNAVSGYANNRLSGTGTKGTGTNGPTKITSIGDRVWIDLNNNGIQDPAEPGVPNVMVVLYDSLLNTLLTRYTDSNGHYLFEDVPVPDNSERSFMVGFYNIPPNYSYTKQLTDSSYAETGSKADPINGRTKLFTMKAGTVRNDIDGGIKSAPGIILPLTIDQFNGMYSNGFIQLRWTTFTDINVDHFEIERSTDGTNFRQVGRVDGAGINANASYNYSDLTADKGSNFYRLVIVDNEGNYTYSKIITVSIDVKGISVLVVYPNPFSKRVVVKISSEKDNEQVTIHIINNDGTVLRTQLANVLRGENNITIRDVDELPGGIYFLEVIAEHRVMKTKLMKQ